MNLALLGASIQRAEGCRLTAYRDTRGVLTIGWGHNLNVPISQAAADLIFSEDLIAVVKATLARWPWLGGLDDVRQNVFAELAYNLGVEGLAGFKAMLAAAERHEFDPAADELQNSAWFGQVGIRGPRLVAQLRTGTVAVDGPQG